MYKKCFGLMRYLSVIIIRMNNFTFFLLLVILPWVKIPIVFITFLGFSGCFNSPILDYFDQNTSDTSYYHEGKCNDNCDIN